MWSSSLCAAFRQPVPLTPKSRIVGDSPTRGWGGRLGTLLAASRGTALGPHAAALPELPVQRSQLPPTLGTGCWGQGAGVGCW